MTEEFTGDAIKQTQWKAFLEKGGLNAPESLAETVARIRELILPLLQSASIDHDRVWEPGGPWKSSRDQG